MFKNLFSFYKKTLSLSLKTTFGGGCRFSPTCSEYFTLSCRRFGFLKGTLLGFKRFLRCHPWGNFGFDPVPLKFKL